MNCLSDLEENVDAAEEVDHNIEQKWYELKLKPPTERKGNLSK